MFTVVTLSPGKQVFLKKKFFFPQRVEAATHFRETKSSLIIVGKGVKARELQTRDRRPESGT